MRLLVRGRGKTAIFLLPGVLLTAFSIALTIFLFDPFRHAAFGLVDDHEILRYLGSDHRVALGDIPHILMTQTEVGQWGQSARFRPVYYFLRVSEAMVNGDHAGRWYLVRMAIMVCTAVGTSMLVLWAAFAAGSGRIRLFMSGALALLVAALIITLPAWQDISTRLGPSETYVALGLTVFLIGGCIVFGSPERTYAWLLFALGFTVAIGSKEDCILLLVPFVAVYFLRFTRAKMKPLVLVVFIAVILFAMFVALGVSLGLASAGSDVYGNQRSIGLFLSVISGNGYLFATLVAFFIAFVVESRSTPASTPIEQSGPIRRVTKYLSARPRSLVAALCVFFVLGEAYFYQNSYSGTEILPARYGYLTEFCTVMAISAAILSLFIVSLPNALTAIALTLGVVSFIAASPVGNQLPVAIQAHRASAIATVGVLGANFAQIAGGASELSSKPTAQAVFIVDNAYDYEPVYSLPQFLAYYGRNEGIYLRMQMDGSLDNAPGRLKNPALLADLYRMSRQGNVKENWRVLPEGSLKTDRPIVCFYVDSQPLDTSFCNSVFRVG